MSDFYTEQLVKRKTSSGATAAKAGMIVLTCLSVLTVLLLPFGIIFPVIMIVADYILFRRLDIEYEYLYVNGELDIDIIMAKQKRKRKYSTNIGSMEILAPQNAPEVRNVQAAKSYDFSSGVDDVKKYEMIVMDGGQRIRILFEPNQAILEGIKMLAPRKVIY